MCTITTLDDTRIYYKDWGTGQPLMFSHSWPLNADSWEAQMLFLASRGDRCIAPDRRGHGRSSQPGNGNDMGSGGTPTVRTGMSTIRLIRPLAALQ